MEQLLHIPTSQKSQSGQAASTGSWSKRFQRVPFITPTRSHKVNRHDLMSLLWWRARRPLRTGVRWLIRSNEDEHETRAGHQPQDAGWHVAAILHSRVNFVGCCCYVPCVRTTKAVHKRDSASPGLRSGHRYGARLDPRSECSGEDKRCAPSGPRPNCHDPTCMGRKQHLRITSTTEDRDGDWCIWNVMSTRCFA